MQPLKIYKKSIGFFILKHQNLLSLLSPLSSPFHLQQAKGICPSYACILQLKNFCSVAQPGNLLKDRQVNWCTGSWKPLLLSKVLKLSSTLSQHKSLPSGKFVWHSGSSRVEWGGEKEKGKECSFRGDHIWFEKGLTQKFG